MPTVSRTGAFVTPFVDYHRRYLVDESLSVLTELLSLRAYWMTIASNHYSNPTCYWFADMSTLYFKEHILVVSQLRNMVASVISDAQSLVCDHLVFQQPSYLSTRDSGEQLDWVILQYAEIYSYPTGRRMIGQHQGQLDSGNSSRGQLRQKIPAVGFWGKQQRSSIYHALARLLLAVRSIWTLGDQTVDEVCATASTLGKPSNSCQKGEI